MAELRLRGISRVLMTLEPVSSSSAETEREPEPRQGLHPAPSSPAEVIPIADYGSRQDIQRPSLRSTARRILALTSDRSWGQSSRSRCALRKRATSFRLPWLITML